MLFFPRILFSDYCCGLVIEVLEFDARKNKMDEQDLDQKLRDIQREYLDFLDDEVNVFQFFKMFLFLYNAQIVLSAVLSSSCKRVRCGHSLWPIHS